VFLGVPAGAYTIDARRAVTHLTFEAGAPGASFPSLPGLPDQGLQSGGIGSGPPGSGYATRGGSVPDRYWTRTPITVGAVDVDGIVIALNRSLSISGRMAFEGTTRLVAVGVPAGGRAGGAQAVVAVTTPPDRGPVIYAEPADADPSLGVARSSGAISPDGTDPFAIDGLRRGEYVLRAQGASGRYLIKSITIGREDFTFKPIDTAARRDLTDVVITFTDKVPIITGDVRGDQGPAGPTAVIAFPVERDQWTRYGFTPTRLKGVPTEGSAGYRMSGLPAGEYHLVAVDIAQITAWQDPKFLERAAAVATRVKLEWGDARTVNLNLARIR